MNFKDLVIYMLIAGSTFTIFLSVFGPYSTTVNEAAQPYNANFTAFTTDADNSSQSLRYKLQNVIPGESEDNLAIYLYGIAQLTVEFVNYVARTLIELPRVFIGIVENMVGNEGIIDFDDTYFGPILKYSLDVITVIAITTIIFMIYEIALGRNFTRG